MQGIEEWQENAQCSCRYFWQSFCLQVRNWYQLFSKQRYWCVKRGIRCQLVLYNISDWNEKATSQRRALNEKKYITVGREYNSSLSLRYRLIWRTNSKPKNTSSWIKVLSTFDEELPAKEMLICWVKSRLQKLPK